MYGALLLFESEFVHIVAISFTSLILTELLMVALTIQTWHWLMIVGELLSLACYVASLVFLHEFIGEQTQASRLTATFTLLLTTAQCLRLDKFLVIRKTQVSFLWTTVFGAFATTAAPRTLLINLVVSLR